MFIKSHPILSRFLFWVVMPIILVLSLAYGFLLQSLPQVEGVVQVKGLDSPVKIIRDEHAIPHISATTDHDAFFALGYVHAQDRLWQMTYNKRSAQGRLSEILGRNSLDSDRLMRTLDLSRSAQTALQSLGEPARQVLTAYADGVNAWIKEENILPIEFHLLNTEPEEWHPTDSLLLIKYMAHLLGRFNYSNKLQLDLLVKELGLDKANELSPNVNSRELSVTDATGVTDKGIAQGLIAQSGHLQHQPNLRGEGLGSNAWVVSGKYTKSGLPLLASDPHLGVEIPAAWYLAEIKGEGLNVIGATYPGAPIVLMGHNESIAWGNTNMLADAQDLYVVRTNPVNEDQYEVDGQWLDMEVKEELIYVKSDSPRFLTDPIPPIEWQVRKTHHGPLISDAIGRVERPLAIQWTALDERDTTFQSFLDILYAENWTSFKSALEGFGAPALNFIYADTHGDIGLFAAGKIPIRRQSDGRLPVPGWLSTYGWDGYIPFDSVPQTLNPEKGYLVNANDRNHPIDYPYLIANTWAVPYRAERIHQTLESHIRQGRKITAQDSIDLQGNVESLQVQQLLPFLLALTPQTPQQEKTIKQLQQWDGVLSDDSGGALTYQVWLRHFNTLLVGDDLTGGALHEARGNELQGYVAGLRPTFMNTVVNQRHTLQTDWCDRVDTTTKETCEELALDALDSAIDEIDRQIGANKQWGDIHILHYPHPVFTHTQPLDIIFDRTTGDAGDRYTVKSGNWAYSEDRGYVTIGAANYRQVIDLGDQGQGGFINSTGQSGNILSEHYDDYIQPFKQLKLWSMNLADGQGSERVATLTLEPIN